MTRYVFKIALFFLYIDIIDIKSFFHVCYNQMHWMYKAIDKHWNIFTDDIEIRVMKEYSMLSRKFVKYYLSEYVL